jgi:hypothetical protein
MHYKYKYDLPTPHPISSFTSAEEACGCDKEFNVCPATLISENMLPKSRE